MAFSKKPSKKDYPNTYSGKRAYEKAMRKWKSEGTTRTNKRSLAKEKQIKVGGKWVNKADWEKQTKEKLKITPKSNNQGEQFTHTDNFAFKDKKKQKEYETGLAKIKAKETSGVGPVKSGAEYAKKLKGATKGVGPVKDGDTYAEGIKKSKSPKKDKLKARAKELGLRDNSPAAKAGFSLKERIALREKHNQWKADRKAGKLKIGNKKRKRGG